MTLEIMLHVQEARWPWGSHQSLVNPGSIMDMTVSNTYPNPVRTPGMPPCPLLFNAAPS